MQKQEVPHRREKRNVPETKPQQGKRYRGGKNHNEVDQDRTPDQEAETVVHDHPRTTTPGAVQADIGRVKVKV